MLLRYGKHINYLAITFLLVTFFGFLLSVTSLSHYSTPTTFTLLKASFWTTVILTIIGFGREKAHLRLYYLAFVHLQSLVFTLFPLSITSITQDHRKELSINKIALFFTSLHFAKYQFLLP